MREVNAKAKDAGNLSPRQERRDTGVHNNLFNIRWLQLNVLVHYKLVL